MYDRKKTKLGANIDLSLFGVLSEWMSVPLAYYEYGDKLLKGTGLDHAQVAPYGNFLTSDGSVFLVIQNHREWENFCDQVLEMPDLTTDKRFKDNASRVSNLDALKTTINEAFTAISRKELMSKLLSAGIACGNVNNVADLSNHPALIRSEVTSGGKIFRTIKHIGCSTPQLKIPALGEHNDPIKNEFSV